MKHYEEKPGERKFKKKARTAMIAKNGEWSEQAQWHWDHIPYDGNWGHAELPKTKRKGKR